MRSSSMNVLWSAALAMAANACIATVEGGNEDEVAVVQQALGGFTEVVNFGTGAVLDVGPTYTVFRRSGACAVLDVVLTTTGAAVPVPLLSSCPNVTAASSQSGVLVAERTSAKIYKLVQGPITKWVAVANTGTANVSELESNGTHVFWYDGVEIHRVNLTTLVVDHSYTGSGASLLAAESSHVLWVNAPAWTLLHENWVLGSPMIQGAAGAAESFDKGFTLDANYLYWISSSGNAIRRIEKAAGGGVITNARSSTTETFFAPVSSGSALYWVDKRISNGATFLRRRNLANGNQVAVSFPFSPPNYMRLLADGLYFPTFDSTVGWGLYRTQR